MDLRVVILQILNKIKELLKSMSQSWRDHVLPCLREDQQEEYNSLRERLNLPRVTVKAPTEADKIKFEKQQRLEEEKEKWERENIELLARESADAERVTEGEEQSGEENGMSDRTVDAEASSEKRRREEEKDSEVASPSPKRAARGEGECLSDCEAIAVVSIVFCLAKCSDIVALSSDCCRIAEFKQQQRRAPTRRCFEDPNKKGHLSQEQGHCSKRSETRYKQRSTKMRWLRVVMSSLCLATLLISALQTLAYVKGVMLKWPLDCFTLSVSVSPLNIVLSLNWTCIPSYLQLDMVEHLLPYLFIHN